MNKIKKFLDFAAKLLFLLCIILPAWLLSSTRVHFLVVLVSVIIFTFAIKFLSELFSKNRIDISDKTTFWASIFLFLFVLYNYVQAYNVRTLSIKFDTYTLLRDIPFFHFLPSSVQDNFLNFSAKTNAMLFLGIYCFFVLCVKMLKDEKFRKIALLLFAFNALVIGLFAVWEKYHYSIMFDSYFSSGDYYGTFFLSNACGAYLGMANVVFLAFSFDVQYLAIDVLLKKIFLFICAIITSFCVYKSGSLGAIFFCALSWVVLSISVLVRLKKWKCLVAAMLTLAVSLYVFANNYIFGKNEVSAPVDNNISIDFKQMNGRIPILMESLNLVKKYPVYGCGFSAFSTEINRQKYSGEGLAEVNGYINLNNPHSSFMHFIVANGIVGFSILSIWWILITVNAIKSCRKYSFRNVFIFEGALVFLLYGIFDMHLSAVPATMFAYILLVSSVINHETWGRDEAI